MAVCQLLHLSLIHRHREQAPSHISPSVSQGNRLDYHSTGNINPSHLSVT